MCHLQEAPQPNDTAAAFRNLHLERGFSLETSSSSSSSDDDDLSTLQRPAVVRPTLSILGVSAFESALAIFHLLEWCLRLDNKSPLLTPPVQNAVCQDR